MLAWQARGRNGEMTLPTVPRQQLAAIVERDVLGLLGIQTPSQPQPPRNDTLLGSNEP